LDQSVATTLQPVLDQYLVALNAVANGDPEPVKALCSNRDDMSQCGLWGGVERGWAEVSERWDWVADQFVPGAGSVTVDTILTSVTSEMAYGVYIEHWWGHLKSRPAPNETESPIRVTLVFRLEDGDWKAVHRHGDNLITKAGPQ
jgi:hypothetical protein